MRKSAAKIGSMTLTAGLMAASAAAAQSLTPEAPHRSLLQEEAALLDELVVTAQKREENIQDVPIAISAYKAERRELIGVVNTRDLVQMTPGMSFGSGGVTLRGVGRTTSAFGTDPGVAVYHDGIYQTDPGFVGLDTFLLDRTEILRGPQGTLFGRNSLGGAVLQTSKSPADSFEGEVMVGYSEYAAFRSGLRVSGPITENLKGLLGLGYTRFGRSHIENVAGKDANTTSTPSITSIVEYEPTDNIRIWLKGGISWMNATSGPTGLTNAPYTTALTATPTALYVGAPHPLYGHARSNPVLTDRRSQELNYRGGSKSRVPSHTGTAHVDLDLGPTILKYIGGFTRYKVQVDQDADGIARTGMFNVPYTGVCTPANCPYPGGSFQAAADIRLAVSVKAFLWQHEIDWSSNHDGPLQWIVGAFTYKENNTSPTTIYSQDQPELVNAANPRGEMYRQFTDLDASAYALFGQADYAINDQLTATLGMRYSWETKVGLESLALRAWQPNLFMTSAVVPLSNSSRTLSEEWEGWSGRAALRWEIDPDTTAYASLSRGWKAGGFALGSLDAEPYVNSEKLNAVEAGLKKSFGRQLIVNSAIFYNDYRDLQARVTEDVGLADGGTATGQTRTRLLNVPKARSYGFELEANYAPAHNLQFFLSYGFLDAEYVDFPNVIDTNRVPRVAVDLDGGTMQASPRHKYALNGLYTLDFKPGSLALSATYSWTAKQYSGIFDSPLTTVPAYSDLDLRATWTDADKRFRIVAFVTNATNEFQITSSGASTNVVPLPGFNAGTSWQVSAPRIFGAEFRYFF